MKAFISPCLQGRCATEYRSRGTKPDASPVRRAEELDAALDAGRPPRRKRRPALGLKTKLAGAFALALLRAMLPPLAMGSGFLSAAATRRSRARPIRPLAERVVQASEDLDELVRGSDDTEQASAEMTSLAQHLGRLVSQFRERRMRR